MTTALYNLALLLCFLTSSTSEIQFDKKHQNFGEIPEGKIINLQFEFSNPSDTPLILYSVNGSCGCTATSFPTFPIKPHQKEHITIKFMSKGKSGQIDMHVLVNSNAKTKTDTLHISGLVKHR